jgi:hypothetical protein
MDMMTVTNIDVLERKQNNRWNRTNLHGIWTDQQFMKIISQGTSGLLSKKCINQFNSVRSFIIFCKLLMKVHSKSRRD